MSWDQQVQSALAELWARDKRAIEEDTAWKWAARAAAAVRLADRDVLNRLRWTAAAVEYGHEAIEHAASARQQTLDQVKDQLRAESVALFGDP